MNNSQEKVVGRKEGSQKGTVDNHIEILNPFDNLATEKMMRPTSFKNNESHNPHISI